MEKNEKVYGTWSTNNGNTFGSKRVAFNTVLGAKRWLNAVVRGNATGYTDYCSWVISDKDGAMIEQKRGYFGETFRR